MLQEAVRRTIRLKQLSSSSRRRKERRHASPHTLPSGTLAPVFTARVGGTGRLVSLSDLKGHSTILLFVSPGESSSPFYAKLSAGTHALWHKADGHLYIVCRGGEQPCHQIMVDHQVEGFSRGHVPMILDEGGYIAERFLVSSTPQAVMLDEDARIIRYGSPLLEEVTLGAD